MEIDAQNQGVIRAEVLGLMKQKDKIESEIRELTGILTQVKICPVFHFSNTKICLKQNGVGMSEPLVDSEGFPISSIDTYQVRHARHRIICLQNDHKALMKRIEQGLQGYYSAAGSDYGMDTQPVNMERSRLEIVTHQQPFARVTIVSEGSPASYAGFQVGDEVVEFGSVNSTNFRAISDIATVVQHSEGTQVNVKLKRCNQFVTVQLIPRKWSGKGLLGCNIVVM